MKANPAVDPNGGSVNSQGIWVQFLEIPLAETLPFARVQERIELIPHNRLSLGGLQEPDGETMFETALRFLDEDLPTGTRVRPTPISEESKAVPFLKSHEIGDISQL